MRQPTSTKEQANVDAHRLNAIEVSYKYNIQKY